MYTEFYSIWSGSNGDDVREVNNRIAELKQMAVDNLEVFREREKEILYITITYATRPGDGDIEGPDFSVPD